MALRKSQLYGAIRKSCDELRGGMDASQYKDYALVLLFVRYVSDKYAGKSDAIVEVPKGGGFADLVKLKGKPNIGEGINKVLSKLAEANNLKGVIDIVDFNDEDKLGRIDPSDAGNPHGINILAAKSEAEKNVTISDFVSAVRRSSTSWGDQMTTVLSNAVHAFLESERGGTLFDLRKFLLEEEFREEFLKSVGDPEVVYFWQHQYCLLRGGTSSWILTRLDSFLRSKLVRRVIAPCVELNFGGIMSRRQVFLAKLSQGLIGEENSTLLGNLIVSKLHQAALARQALRAEEREPFFLYIDEFHNFVTPSLAGVLSGARKYGLGLVLAHQDLRQIWNQDTAVANSVISNPGTRVSFRVGDFDARKLQDGFAHFNAPDLQSLGVGEAIAKIDSANDDFNLSVSLQKSVPSEIMQTRTDIILQANRRAGGTVSIPGAKPPLSTPSAPPFVDENIPETAANKEPGKTVRTKPSPRPERIAPPGGDDEAALPQHRYLQALIKRMAEERGYRAVIEAPTPDGGGRVDIGLEGNGERIACEVRDHH